MHSIGYRCCRCCRHHCWLPALPAGHACPLSAAALATQPLRLTAPAEQRRPLGALSVSAEVVTASSKPWHTGRLLQDCPLHKTCQQHIFCSTQDSNLQHALSGIIYRQLPACLLVLVACRLQLLTCHQLLPPTTADQPPDIAVTATTQQQQGLQDTSLQLLHTPLLLSWPELKWSIVVLRCGCQCS